jgi:hypothetical protein
MGFHLAIHIQTATKNFVVSFHKKRRTVISAFESSSINKDVVIWKMDSHDLGEFGCVLSGRFAFLLSSLYFNIQERRFGKYDVSIDLCHRVIEGCRMLKRTRPDESIKVIVNVDRQKKGKHCKIDEIF